MNLVISMANRAMEYRDKVTELLYQPDKTEDEIAPEFKALNGLLMKFEAGSALVDLMVEQNLGELAREVFDDLTIQHFVFDLQFYLLSVYTEEEIGTVTRQLCRALAVNRPVRRDEVELAASVVPTDNPAYQLTAAEIEETFTTTPWLLGLFLLSLAVDTRTANGTPSSPA